MKIKFEIMVMLGLVGSFSIMTGCSKVKEEVIDLGKGVKLEMMLVPKGNFKMGFTKKEFNDLKVTLQEEYKFELKKELGKKELDNIDKILSFQGNQHDVTITKPFYIGKYEITQEQWEAVIGSNPSSTTKGAKLPVTDISWEDCQDFIKKLNAKAKGSYRLPTEAEWEIACRAGTSTAYSFGNSLTESDANIKGSVIKVVGNYKPNAFGLYDMHGNVWEWCEDWYAAYPKESVIDPKGPAAGEDRVLRGGSFYSNVSQVCSSNRNVSPPTNRNGRIGFRLAKDK